MLHKHTLNALALLAAVTAFAGAACADEARDAAELWGFHVQSTLTGQYHPQYHSPYQGANSMPARDESQETFDVTLYAGMSPWKGAEVWLNPEIDQGFGLGNTLGAAGYVSGEAYKVGRWLPYWRLPRAFFRQTINLGGAADKTEADLNQLAGRHTADRLVFTAGKFAVVDVFDNNQYAHDARNDFLNWSILDIGSFDYAADAWGYTEGMSLEGYWDRYALRGGIFAMSTLPNSEFIDTNFSQFQVPVEFEESHTLMGRPGKLRALLFLTHARMAAYDDVVAAGLPADLTGLRRSHNKMGGGLNLEQQLSDNLGFFARAGMTQGKYEAFDFTDINQSLSFGLSWNGSAWSRPKDTAGLGFAVNNASPAAKRFFAAGGLGILVGDGQLPDAAAEKIAEAYYSATVIGPLKLTADYQLLVDPAYNAQRGPISVFGLRAHVQF